MINLMQDIIIVSVTVIIVILFIAYKKSSIKKEVKTENKKQESNKIDVYV